MKLRNGAGLFCAVLTHRPDRWCAGLFVVLAATMLCFAVDPRPDVVINLTLPPYNITQHDLTIVRSLPDGNLLVLAYPKGLDRTEVFRAAPSGTLIDHHSYPHAVAVLPLPRNRLLVLGRVMQVCDLDLRCTGDKSLPPFLTYSLSPNGQLLALPLPNEPQRGDSPGCTPLFDQPKEVLRTDTFERVVTMPHLDELGDDFSLACVVENGQAAIYRKDNNGSRRLVYKGRSANAQLLTNDLVFLRTGLKEADVLRASDGSVLYALPLYPGGSFASASADGRRLAVLSGNCTAEHKIVHALDVGEKGCAPNEEIVEVYDNATGRSIFSLRYPYKRSTGTLTADGARLALVDDTVLKIFVLK